MVRSSRAVCQKGFRFFIFEVSGGALFEVGRRRVVCASLGCGRKRF